MRDAIKKVWNAYDKISNAYIYKRALDSSAERLSASCASITEASDTLNQVVKTPAIQQMLSGVSNSGFPYANVASRSKRGNAPQQCVSLDRGKAFNIPCTNCIIIGSSEEALDKFADSKITKSTLQSGIDPVQLKLKINRVGFDPKKSVILAGDSLDASTLVNCLELAKAGLEIKTKAELNP